MPGPYSPPAFPPVVNFSNWANPAGGQRPGSQPGDAAHHGPPHRAQGGGGDGGQEESGSAGENRKYPAPHPHGDIQKAFLIVQVWESGEG